MEALERRKGVDWLEEVTSKEGKEEGGVTEHSGASLEYQRMGEVVPDG